MEDFDYNPFFVALKGPLKAVYKVIQAKQWTIVLPKASSLTGVKFTKEFADTHTLKPSQYFVGQLECVNPKAAVRTTYASLSRSLILLSLPFAGEHL